MIVGALPKPPRFLTLPEILTLHEMSIVEYGGSHGVRDAGLLDSALAMPPQSFGGQFAHDVPFGMAAAYGFHICKNHPFVDGNKRTALGAMITFLRINGWNLTVDDLVVGEQILKVAEGSCSKDELSEWIASHTSPRPSIELRDFFLRLDADSMQQLTDAIKRGQEAEIHASFLEAAEAIPLMLDLLQVGQAALASGDQQRSLVANANLGLLITLYRVAEDMGYEW